MIIWPIWGERTQPKTPWNRLVPDVVGLVRADLYGQDGTGEHQYRDVDKAGWEGQRHGGGIGWGGAGRGGGKGRRGGGAGKGRELGARAAAGEDPINCKGTDTKPHIPPVSLSARRGRRRADNPPRWYHRVACWFITQGCLIGLWV